MRLSRIMGHCSVKLSKAASKTVRSHLHSHDEILVPILSKGEVRIPWEAIAIDRTKRVEHVFAGTGDRYAEHPKIHIEKYNIRLVDDDEHVFVYLGSDTCAMLSDGRESFRVNIEIEHEGMIIRAV